MLNLQQVFEKKIIDQINKSRTDPIQKITITYKSDIKNRDISRMKMRNNLRENIYNLHINKQYSEISLKQIQAFNNENNDKVVNLFDDINNKQQLNQIEQNVFSIRKISNHSNMRRSVNKKLKVCDDEQKLKAEQQWKRKQEYGKRIRDIFLPKIKQTSELPSKFLNQQQKSSNNEDDSFFKQISLWKQQQQQLND